MKRKNSIKLALFTIISLVVILFSSGCSGKPTLLFLNWGEYINDELVAIFEEKYNCNVIVDIADSNELFYAKLKSGTTKYDLCCPADYMVEKMYINGLIQRIDFNKLTNFPKVGDKFMFEEIFMDGVIQIEQAMNDDMKAHSERLNFEYDYEGNEINYYHMPYFWGTFGLMYNKVNPFFADNATYDKQYNKLSDEPDGYPDCLQRVDPWKVYFFDPSLSAEDSLPQNTKVGMYDSVRFNYGAFTTYYGGTPNLLVDDKIEGATITNIEAYQQTLSRRKYKEWGGDTLKHGIESHNLDIAYAYTGDCLDMVYMKIKEDGLDFEQVEFYTYTPAITPAHVDTLVIPSESRHVDLAHKFLDFLLDADYSWVNTRDVGYCPPMKSVYNMIVNLETPKKEVAYEEAEDEQHWLENWRKAIITTFPIDDEGKSINVGIPYSYFENDDIKRLTNIMNNIIARS